MTKRAITGTTIFAFILTICAWTAILKADDNEDAPKSSISTSINVDVQHKSDDPKQDVKFDALKSQSNLGNQSCCGTWDEDNCCEGCDCGPCGQFWVREEYVNWWARGGRVPALLVTSPTPDFTTTRTLYGDADYNGGYRPGTWTDMGMWLDCCKSVAIEGGYFWAGNLNSPFSASSSGVPILGRPFIDAITGLPRFEDVGFGRVNITNENNLQGAGIDFRHNLCCSCDCCQNCCDTCYFHGQRCCRLDYTMGFRYYNFDDNLRIDEHITSTDPTSGIPVGTQLAITDSFRTQNNFYGMEVGLVAQRYVCRWMLEGSAKVAFGDMQKLVEINGQTAITVPGQPTVINQGGFLALSSNIGHYQQDQVTAIPIFTGRIGYRATDHITLLAGYTLIYFGNVARAGDQIDTVVNPNLLPPPIGGGPNRPAFAFHNSSLWLQGVTIGAEIDF